ncbi:MAG: hypothetical protein M1820_004281 [Bogoriella megaspora]|nr:MAG: hypothetical protein M1820_004281 [Bogoriella megaspora]
MRPFKYTLWPNFLKFDSTGQKQDERSGVNASITTEIHLAKIDNSHIDGNEPQHAEDIENRKWGIRIIHNGEEILGNKTLLDPFLQGQYPKTFEFFANSSFEAHIEGRSRANDLQVAKEEIDDYGKQLLKQLGLESFGGDTPRSTTREIIVVEDPGCNDEDYKSIHNPVWELLERVEYWRREPAPERVNVTRVISYPQEDNETPQIRTVPESIRILLVIGRNIRAEKENSFWKYSERVDPGLIQKPLMQVIRHLEIIGHKQSIELEILRPATHNELRSYLGCNAGDRGTPKEQFDIIHIDTHGIMLSPLMKPDCPKEPYLMFTSSNHNIQAPVSARDLAATLSKCTKVLVMNACNMSSPYGGLGITLVRNFLAAGIDQVAGTSYKLQVTAAQIFYPTFYMSYLLKRSFSGAAADARLALRRDLRRHEEEERDDHFIHWNWSNNANNPVPLAPRRPFRLHCKRAIEVVQWLFSVAMAGLHLKKADIYSSNDKNNYPMCEVHERFYDVLTHVDCALRLKPPGISLHGMEIEWHLKEHMDHSVYLYPADGAEFIIPRIRDLIHNMVRIWVETSFVCEVRVLQIRKMIAGRMSWGLPTPLRSWIDPSYETLMEKADWSWPQRPKNMSQYRKPPQAKTLLIISDFDHLIPLKTMAQRKLLRQIQHVAREIYASEGDSYYLITTGRSKFQSFMDLEEPYKLKDCGLADKWGNPWSMNLPLVGNIELATNTYLN